MTSVVGLTDGVFVVNITSSCVGYGVSSSVVGGALTGYGVLSVVGWTTYVVCIADGVSVVELFPRSGSNVFSFVGRTVVVGTAEVGDTTVGVIDTETGPDVGSFDMVPMAVGDAEGDTDGIADPSDPPPLSSVTSFVTRTAVGSAVVANTGGSTIGCALGWNVGIDDGSYDGISVGSTVGSSVTEDTGDSVSSSASNGIAVGNLDGPEVGPAVGAAVGAFDGKSSSSVATKSCVVLMIGSSVGDDTGC